MADGNGGSDDYQHQLTGVRDRHSADAERFSPSENEYNPDYDQDDYFAGETNILNLDSEVKLDSDDMGDQVDLDSDMSDSDDDAEAVESCPGGVLDEDTITNGLNNLARSADGAHQVYLHLNLPGCNIKDISILGEYIQLQKVEIPFNEITDLSPLGNLPYLLELDASNNKISKILDFTPPKNLKIVDLSYNNIVEMSDLGEHHYLMKLVLDHNQINEIKGLEKCHRLNYFSMAHNKIGRIQGLDNLPIKHLNLSFNELTKVDNIENLRYLQFIDLSGNKIRSMSGLEKHNFLETIDLEENEIIDLSEVKYISNLSLLRTLNLQRNPIRELPDYRLSILYRLLLLTELDRRKVDIEEKVASSNMFNPPMEVIAARDHIMHVVYSFMQPSKVLDSTLPRVETPYPMLVLVGPQGAGKKDLALKLVEEFSDYFGYGVSHTTRKPQRDEVPNKDYFFVNLEEFEDTIKTGMFLQTNAYHGELYGLTIDAVESVARDGLACVVHMELEGVLTLKNTYFEPRYVLVMPLSSDAHEARLRDRNLYNETEIQITLQRGELYAEYNRQHPGFFDMLINSDDITDAYLRLRKLVMDYLGIVAPTPSNSELDPSSAQTMLERELTTDTSVSAGLPRARSKPSMSDSLTQAFINLKNRNQSPKLPSGRGIVEQESLKRRQSAAKETLSGYVPSIYEQVVNRTAKTVPQPVSAQLGLKEEMEDETQRSFSAPAVNMDALPPSSPDSSNSESGLASSLSYISEAGQLAEQIGAGSGQGSAVESFKGSRQEVGLPEEVLDRIELLSGSRTTSKNMSNGSVPLAPRPNSRNASGLGLRNESACSGSMSHRSGRPGSDKHPVLPPIGHSSAPILG